MNNRVGLHVHKTAQNSYDKRSSHFPNNRHCVVLSNGEDAVYE